MPTGVETVDVNRDSGKRSSFGCLGDPEVFLLGTAPTESCGLFDFARREPPKAAENAPDGEPRRRPNATCSSACSAGSGGGLTPC